MANDILIPGNKEMDGGTETTAVFFKGQWLRLETVRIGQINSLHPDVPHAQIRNLDDNSIVCTCMHGFWLQHAFVWKDWFYIFGTDYYGIWMTRSFDLYEWSKPQLVFNSENSTEIHYQNNSIVWNGEYFVMAVDLLGGPYSFTICFAKSNDLVEWHYIPGAIYRPHMYTSCPVLQYCDGWYYLFHCRGIEKWLFEPYVARSRDLLVWEDSPNNPILTPDTSEILPAAKKDDDKIYRVCNASDLFVYERDGKTIGYYHIGTQTAGSIGYLKRADYDGPISDFFKELFEPKKP